jgi:hypothetical protein
MLLAGFWEKSLILTPGLSLRRHYNQFLLGKDEPWVKFG